MEVQRYINKWDKLEGNSLSRDIFTALNSCEVKHFDALPDFFDVALSYDFFGTALYSFVQKKSDWCNRKVLEAVENRIHEQVQKDISLDERVSLWKSLVLSWDNQNDAYVGNLAGMILKPVRDRKIPERDKRAKTAVNEFTAMILAPSDIRSYPESDCYIRSMYLLCKLITKEELAGVAIYHKSLLSIRDLKDDSRALMRSYMQMLFNDKNYSALAAFLHNVTNFDYERDFEMTEPEFWDYLLQTGSERLAEYLLRIIGDEDNEKYDLWLQQVYANVISSSCVSWCEWACYLMKLKCFLKNECITQQEFWKYATDGIPKSQFPFEDTYTWNQIVSATITIYASLMERKWDVNRFVNLVSKNGVFHYQNRHNFHRNIVSLFENREQIFPWEEAFQRFMEYPYTIEEFVNVFMNSPLRCRIELRDFVIRLMKKFEVDALKEAFSDYTLEGMLTYIDSKCTGRGHFQLELSKAYFGTKYFFKNRNIPKNKAFYDHLFHSDEQWYQKNAYKICDMDKNMRCTFKICGFESRGTNDGIIYVYEIQPLSPIRIIDKKTELGKIKSWLKNIKESRTMIPVHKNMFPHVYTPASTGQSEQFAELLYDVVWALRDNPEDAMHFLNMINTGTLDKINEFQYLLRQNQLHTFWVNDFEAFLERTRKRVEELCESQAFDTGQKCNIYMNTYVKCFYNFEVFWEKAGVRESDMISFMYRNSNVNQFLFLVDYEGRDNNQEVFYLNKNIQFRIGYSGDEYKWVLTDSAHVPLEKGTSYRAAIKDIDCENHIVFISRLYEKNVKDSWAIFMGHIRDLKKNPSITFIKEKTAAIKQLDIDMIQTGRISQIVDQMTRLYSYVGKAEYGLDYNLFWCSHTLDVFGEESPFVKYMEQEGTIDGILEKKLKDSMKTLIQCLFDMRSNGKDRFQTKELIEFLDKSPYILVYSRKEIRDMVLSLEK